MKNLEDQETARARQKRGQILDAARRLFLSHGYAHTSTDAVRRAAGVSKETLYRYYPTKEELFADILRRLTLEQLPKPLHSDDSLTSGADSKQLQRLVRTLAREISLVMMQPDYLSLLRVVVAESTRFSYLGGLFKKDGAELANRGSSDLFIRSG